ncbi:Uncharacterized protein dnm_098380 [Desulfonema magnum]|uniref:Uncharacterized protein n=1 Tax=Desulfonema magnum TaxID=45655 RepID=A0A975GU30_9BACT|nr:Uncharacterized protein dnm_098380 [Desulfonema magnum]
MSKLFFLLPLKKSKVKQFFSGRAVRGIAGSHPKNCDAPHLINALK